MYEIGSKFKQLISEERDKVYAPPTGSPLALNLHPRLLFIPQSYRDANPNAVGITVQEIMMFTRYEYIFNRRELK